MSKVPPKGIYVPAVVFFDANDELDLPSIQKHVVRLAKGGVTGILVQGSNGEAQFLSRSERQLAIQVTRKALDDNGFKNVVIVAGTGAQSTRETIELCEEAAKSGAEYALVLTPSTWPPQMTKDNTILFHETVAKASPIPTMVYNFPVVTAGINLDSDTIAKLAKHPNIVGTKLSCGDIGKLSRLTSLFPSTEFAVFPGLSDVFLPGLLCKGAGLIGALVNVVPKVHRKLYKLWEDGKVTEATELQLMVAQADWATMKLGGIGALKELIVTNFGYGNGRVRGPLVEADSNIVNNLEGTKLTELIALEKSLE